MNQENKYLRIPEYYANGDKEPEKVNEGYYILTNPFFSNYIKLDYADEVEKHIVLCEFIEAK